MKDLASNNCLDLFQQMRLDITLGVKAPSVSFGCNDWNLEPQPSAEIAAFGTLPLPPQIRNSF
jgi:hypothetical protein